MKETDNQINLYSKINIVEKAKEQTKPVVQNKTQKARRPQRQGSARNGGTPRPAQAAQKPAAAAQKPQANQKSSNQPRSAATQKPARRKSRASGGNNSNVSPLRIIPLGGLEEVGKNITVFEYEDDMIILDCGLKFPDDELLGVDIVIPDFTYVVNNQSRVRGIFVTHGHEDHIGALPYLLRMINVPIYATKLTIGLIEAKFKENGITGVDMNVIVPGQRITLGKFEVEPINVNHSIPDSVGYAINTPIGTVVHTGDFKIDYTPISDKVINLSRFGEIGKAGVLAMMADSTNAERAGYTPTERRVGLALNSFITKAQGKRIIIASFASNIQRIQQIADLAKGIGRKIALSGRSMINYCEIASELGYLNIDKNIIIDISEISHYRDDELVILTTGSQGEPLSALSRMAAGVHRQVTISANDLIIISATPIPGNETSVTKIINALLKKGSEVIYESMYEVHVSGHACQEEIKTMLELVSPKYYIPVHGEYKHLCKNAGLARAMGVPDRNIIIPQIGMVIEITPTGVKTTDTVPAGRVLVDGLGVGDVGNVVLRDRKHLAQDGLIVAVMSIDSMTGEIISGPDVISRGFVYVKESEKLIDGAKEIITKTINECWLESGSDWGTMKAKVRGALNEYMYSRTKRSPMILPVIMDI